MISVMKLHHRYHKKHPLGIGAPKEVANACIFLLSDASRYVTGNNLVIDSGYSTQ
ncbi:SDR family oxidoreductase [Chryseobacterium sp.]|uniref:SDR family oxidoreductase n=1 Tax=Chryseobacterium sp. TaxID=1871047 RepID=UPI002633DFDC|nr:SDR family oxidoreductase [Chryseobacterium sp.]